VSGLLEFESQDNLLRLTLEIGEDSEGGPMLTLKRWTRAEPGDEWELDQNPLNLWPDDPVRGMCEALVPIWSAQAKAKGLLWH